MAELLWKLERIIIVGIRRPGQYLVVLSAIVAGIFSSLEISEPIKKSIDDIPYVTWSEWLYTAIFTLLFSIVLYTLSFVIGSLWGVQPLEYVVSFIDAIDIAPSIADYAERKLKRYDNGRILSFDYRVRRVQSGELDMFNQINREIYKLTAFSLPLHRISQRNKELFNKNSSMFAIIDANIGGRYIPIGISHILTLNDLGKAMYVRQGGLKDGDIRAEHITASGEWSSAIVLFSMGVLPAFRNRLKDRYLTLPYVFVDHLVEIVFDMRTSDPDRADTYVYAQTEKPHGGIGKLLLTMGFENTSITTGDGCTLWRAKLDIAEASRDRGKSIIQELLGTWLARLAR